MAATASILLWDALTLYAYAYTTVLSSNSDNHVALLSIQDRGHDTCPGSFVACPVYLRGGFQMAPMSVLRRRTRVILFVPRTSPKKHCIVGREAWKLYCKPDYCGQSYLLDPR